jgi:NAD(P)-dependent dehydrogenase (short-subunit alcohol dehydrogenase family)
MAARRVAVITGGSRGIGAATVRELADRGFDVAFTYRNKKARADDVAAEVVRAGGAALAIQADITEDRPLALFAAAVRAWRRQVDLLVLNASGGLERDLLAADRIPDAHQLRRAGRIPGRARARTGDWGERGPRHEPLGASVRRRAAAS